MIIIGPLFAMTNFHFLQLLLASQLNRNNGVDVNLEGQRDVKLRGLDNDNLDRVKYLI